ncbi:hypothetical protein ACF061_00920 [Streptomyces sp. NPDC015220]|uniref:hypothetical protein n=1 Tax=Streptomyces sp. NPDC015220 TaxID=3364947 RepID=UPI0036F4F150
MRRRWDDAVGWLLLRLAAVLHRRVASRSAWGRWQDRRDWAIRTAERKGVPVEALAKRMRLTPGRIRQVLSGKRLDEPPAVEDAA